MFLFNFAKIPQRGVNSVLQNSTMGKRIRQRRKELGITQSQLAEMLEISNNHLSSIENGRGSASLDLFCRICAVLKVTPDSILIGQVHSDNVPQNIAEMLQRCSRDDLDLIQHIVEYMLTQHKVHETS